MHTLKEDVKQFEIHAFLYRKPMKLSTVWSNLSCCCKHTCQLSSFCTNCPVFEDSDYKKMDLSVLFFFFFLSFLKFWQCEIQL